MRSADGLRFGAACLAVTLVAATTAFFRWETVHEPVPGVPLPLRSRLQESEPDSAGDADACLLVLDSDREAGALMQEWTAVLAGRGWERVDVEAERAVFRRPGQRLLVNVIRREDREPRTRLRIIVRPCRPADD